LLADAILSLVAVALSPIVRSSFLILRLVAATLAALFLRSASLIGSSPVGPGLLGNDRADARDVERVRLDRLGRLHAGRAVGVDLPVRLMLDDRVDRRVGRGDRAGGVATRLLRPGMLVAVVSGLVGCHGARSLSEGAYVREAGRALARDLCRFDWFANL